MMRAVVANHTCASTDAQVCLLPSESTPSPSACPILAWCLGWPRLWQTWGMAGRSCWTPSHSGACTGGCASEKMYIYMHGAAASRDRMGGYSLFWAATCSPYLMLNGDVPSFVTAQPT